MSQRRIPLFPLGVVLYPEAHLPLRIFEPRYLDMVRDCTRDSLPFGVVAVIRAEPDSDAAPSVSAIGTLAHIVDFYTTSDGLLGIAAIGGARFRTVATEVQADGLLLGTVELLDEAPVLPLPAEFGLVGTLVGSLLDQVGGHHAQAAQERRDDAGWVAHRLAEFLPLELAEKQWLLEQADPVARLQQLLAWLPRFQRE